MDERIGHYRIVEELGRGGMGVVYKAHEDSLNRPVALKVLGDHLAAEEGFVARFVREAQSAAKLQHPNIVQIFFIGEDRGRHFFAMELVPGRSLREIIAEEGRLEISRAVDIAGQAAAGLAAAHDQGVVHRDIKPANLIVTDDGLVKIADFGLALFLGGDATKLTATGALMGTPAYISPEQCEGLKPDRRSDIYSLGITLYEMLSGNMPFQSDSPMGLLRQILQSEPPPVRDLNPEIEVGLAEVLGRMMAKDREQRFDSCHQVLQALAPYRRPGDSPAATAAVGVAPPPLPAALAASAAEAAVVTPPGQVPTVKLAQSTALAPRGETALATPAASRRRLVPLLVALAVLLLAGAGVAGLFLWSQSSGWGREGGSQSAVAELPQPASTAVAGDPSASDDPGSDQASLTTGTAAPPAGLGATPASAGLVENPDSVGSSQAPPPSSSPTIPGAAGAVGGSTSAGDPSTPVPRSAPPPTAHELPATQRTVATPVPGAPAESAEPAEHPTSEERALSAPPPLPARPIVCVIGIGEPVLASASEQLLEEELPRRGLELVDENRWPRIGDLLHARSGLSLESLLGSLDAVGVHVVILVEADFVSERPLRYLDRSDRALTSRLRLNALLTGAAEGLGSGWSTEVEYTQLSARRQAEGSLLPWLRELTGRVETGWDDYRSSR